MKTETTEEILSLIHDIQSPLVALRSLLKDENKNHHLESLAYKKFLNLSGKIKERFLLDNKESYSSVLDAIENTISLKEMEHPKTIFSLHVNPELRDLVFDFSKCDLERSISNILNNAIEAGASQICLKLIQGRSDIQLRVIDNGNGFFAQDIQKVHEKSGFTTKQEGSGIGLSSSINFMSSLKGKLKILSTPYVGTNIIMSFPRSLFESLDYGPSAS